LNISIDVTQILSSYSIAIQQMVAIARVLDISSKILILDEPTSSLDETEVEQLFKVIRSLRDEGLAILFIPVLSVIESPKYRQYLFEILYFFGLGGAVQALFAPDIGLHGLPEPKYFCFFISHGTIVFAVVYAAVLYRVELTWRSWIRIVVLTNAFTLAAYGVNLLLRLIPPYEVGNYFAMGYPPPNGSVIDVFALIYLPYPIARMVRRRREAQPGGT
jgi:hypothetical protein